MAILLLLLQTPLIDRLRSDDPTERESATVELVRLGAGAREALKKALEDPDPEVVARVRRVLEIVEVNDRAAASFFPVGAGFEWTYAVGETLRTVKIGEAPREVRVQHHEPETVPAWPVEGWGSFIVEVDGGVTVVAEQAIGLGRTGTFLAPMASFRWSGEERWNCKTQAGCVVDSHEATRFDLETVEVPAGKFECVRIAGGERGESTVWLAEGVGVVRREMGDEVWTLSAYRTRVEP